MAAANDQDPDRHFYSRHHGGNPPECTNDLLGLAKLLSAPKSSNEDDEVNDPSKRIGANFNPGLIGPPKNAHFLTHESDELEQTLQDTEENGLFEEPKYDVIYKQAVKAEDIYLGLGNKNPSTSCCKWLVVKIWLPDTQVRDIDLDVEPQLLKCKTKKYKLSLPLPHPVEPKDSEGAKLSEGLLTVSLKLNREYDFLNN